MDDELRRSAERVNNPYGPAYADTPYNLLDDARLLARAWLAAHTWTDRPPDRHLATDLRLLRDTMAVGIHSGPGAIRVGEDGARGWLAILDRAYLALTEPWTDRPPDRPGWYKLCQPQHAQHGNDMSVVEVREYYGRLYVMMAGTAEFCSIDLVTGLWSGPIDMTRPAPPEANQ